MLVNRPNKRETSLLATHLWRVNTDIVSHSQIICHSFVHLLSCVSLCLVSGDRYDPEPRSRSMVGSGTGGSKYDPDPHGPLDG